MIAIYVPPNSQKQMIIKIGLIYSQEIGVGVLAYLFSLYVEVLGYPRFQGYEARGHTYANEVYMYVTQSTPLLAKGRTCAVLYIHVFADIYHHLPLKIV